MAGPSGTSASVLCKKDKIFGCRTCSVHSSSKLAQQILRNKIANKPKKKKTSMQFCQKYYSLRPKKQVILGFKICPKKQVILPYLESACACKNQLVPNMDNIQGQTWSFYLLVKLSQNSQDDLYFGTEGVLVNLKGD